MVKSRIIDHIHVYVQYYLIVLFEEYSGGVGYTWTLAY